MRTVPLRSVLALSWTCGVLVCQAATITEQRVRETVTWLAADERRGRNTGSPEIEEAAKWLADRFRDAGLRQVKEGSWTHEFTLPGLVLDSSAVKMALVRKDGKEVKELVLEPDRDIRLWTGSDVVEGRDEACTVARLDDPVMQRMLGAESGRRPVLLEVAEDHPYWQRSAGEHRVLSGRRAAARPVFLVRKSVLPAPPGPAETKDITWLATWSVGPAQKADVPQQNVMALLPGTSAKDEYVVVSAHYDHLGTGNPGGDGDAIYNGADDNATGATAVVLLAEALAKTPMRRSVLFVCFSAEERQLRGSAAFCADPPVPIEQIVCNLNIEMLGRPLPGNEGKAWITGHDLSDFAAIAGQALERRSVGLVDFAGSAQLFAASDNYSFARRGVVAHTVSAGSLHEDYHKPGDEADKLDIAHMTRIVSALVEVVRELADREAKPAWNEAGRKRLERVRR
ncbi:MAG TPA: M28 family peptidase [Planctomycetota bacterium]